MVDPWILFQRKLIWVEREGLGTWACHLYEGLACFFLLATVGGNIKFSFLNVSLLCLLFTSPHPSVKSDLPTQPLRDGVVRSCWGGNRKGTLVHTPALTLKAVVLMQVRMQGSRGYQK